MRYNCFILLSFFVIINTSCATIFGGSNYTAHVSVKDHPNAVIKYNGIMKGKGAATIIAKRADANKFIVSVQDGNCVEKIDTFSSRSIRVGALVGSILGWTGVVNGIPLPWGVGVDFATGAIWKPNVSEKGVSKIDYRNFSYEIDYSGCPPSNNNSINTSKTRIELIKELKELYDKGALTKDEFEAEKKKIMKDN